MKELVWAESTYPLDAHGFLSDPGKWDQDFAQGMAHHLELPEHLTVRHWKVVLFVRKYFVRRWSVPRIHETCRHCRLTLSGLRTLFPPGYQRGVCRIAGIPYGVIATRHYALTYETRPTRLAGRATTPPGFLRDFRTWDTGFAREAARENGTPVLTPEHWRVIDHFRSTFADTGQLPCLLHTCREIGIGLEDWTQLFPDGFRYGVVRVAGLPAMAR